MKGKKITTGKPGNDSIVAKNGKFLSKQLLLRIKFFFYAPVLALSHVCTLMLVVCIMLRNYNTGD